MQDAAASWSSNPSRANSRVEFADSAIAAPISVSSGACSKMLAAIPLSRKSETEGQDPRFRHR